MTTEEINWNKSLKEIGHIISTSREIKGNNNQTVKLIDQAIDTVEDFIVNMYLEKASLFQLVYMSERDTGKGNKGLMREAVKNMEEVIDHVNKYIKLNGLVRWQSRVSRFYGRVCDYKEDFKTSIVHYKMAIRYAKLDPEHVNDGVPRHLEYQAFLVYARMMAGSAKEGFLASKKLYNTFKTSPDGKRLKRKDYTVWAIWITGIAIRATDALIKTKTEFNKKEILAWLADSEAILTPKSKTKTWADFGYRKTEIAALKKLLKAR